MLANLFRPEIDRLPEKPGKHPDHPFEPSLLPIPTAELRVQLTTPALEVPLFAFAKPSRFYDCPDEPGPDLTVYLAHSTMPASGFDVRATVRHYVEGNQRS